MTERIRERLPSDLYTAGAVGTAPSSPRSRVSTSDPSGARPDYDRVGDAPHYVQFLANVGRYQEAEHPVRMSEAERAAAVGRRRVDTEVQTRLDAFRAGFSGPYVVDGKEVWARPMFRMNGGANEPKRRAHEAELDAICRKAHVSPVAVYNAKVGRPTPGQLGQVTQALIDAKKLGPGTDESLELRIRQMQWEWSIGVDCAGYTEQAARAARGQPPRAPTHGDVFTGLRHDRSMRKVEIADIRPGDVIHLDPAAADEVGHNVVVYAHHTLGPEERTRLASAKGPLVETFLGGKGPFHLIHVDSSWGAGLYGKDHGGFRRDTWLFDEGSHTWGYFESATKTFATSKTGPHDEPYTGAFRPRIAS